MTMQEEIFCSHCADFTEHSTVKMGREHLVRCMVCGTVHPHKLERTRLAILRVIVSAVNSSSRRTIELPAEETLEVGDELLVDDGVGEVAMVEVTSIEMEGGRRDERARAGDVKTLWTRAVDEVVVKVAVHRRGKTTSYSLPVGGDEPFEVGEVRTAGGRRFRVEKIQLRDGRSPARALAKDIIRVWGGAI
ncbi:MAG: hypothetical protein NUK54_04160 [Methanothrix sp.]|nr:hypothetical protein [Methanothrix sp.]